MDNNTFNKDLDKITEKETVYDFVERLKIGREFKISEDNSIKFPPNTLLLDLLKYLFKFAPSSLINHPELLSSCCIKMDADSDIGSVSLNSENEYFLFMAISDKTGMDISSCISKEFFNSTTTFTLKTDTPYKYEDNITLYVYNKE